MRIFFLVFLIAALLVPAVSAQNVILNSSFEFWLDSLGVRMPFAWFTSEASDSGSAVRVIDPHSGIYALKLNGSDTLAYALTASIAFSGHNYVFAGWCKSNSLIAGSFIITWLNLSQQIVGNPVIVPIYRSTNWQRYSQIVQCPDSANIVNVNVIALPTISLTVDDVTLTDTVLAGIQEKTYCHRKPATIIYPNPAPGIIHIETDNAPVFIEMYDVKGRRADIQTQNETHGFKIDARHLPSGIYFVRTAMADQSNIQKVIINR